MKVKVLVLALILFLNFFAYSQNNIENFSKAELDKITQQFFKINSKKYNENKENRIFNIAILKVEFLEDNSPLTTGNGKFNYNVDPQHDNAYFNNMFSELKKYYKKVSNNKVDINYSIFPAENRKAYQLNKRMLEYGTLNTSDNFPAGINTNLDTLNTKIIKLYKDALETASLQDTLNQIDWESYDLFIVLHAGVDRATDVNNDSPYDLYSTYLYPNDFKKYMGIDSLVIEGKSIKEGIVLPEAYTQDGIGVIGSLGTIARMFGYYLGLPTLNAPDGTPRAGIWDLMDYGTWNGQGFLPAEPSAWTRMFKNWVDVIEVKNDTTITLASVENSYKIVKIPINNDEYFLIENRQRDGNGNGTFNSDEYDQALIGSGLLIWHIDEKVIRENYLTNTINADKYNLGIDLEEADGVQDLEKNRYDIIYMTEFDPFKAPYNRTFSDSTYPNTKSKKGLYSGIKIYDISQSGYEMTFKVKFSKEINTEFAADCNINYLFKSNDDVYLWLENNSFGKLTNNTFTELYNNNIMSPIDFKNCIEIDNKIVYSRFNELYIYDKNSNNFKVKTFADSILSFSFINNYIEIITKNSYLLYDDNFILIFDNNLNYKNKLIKDGNDTYLVEIGNNLLKIRNLNTNYIKEINDSDLLNSDKIISIQCKKKNNELGLILRLNNKYLVYKFNFIENSFVKYSKWQVPEKNNPDFFKLIDCDNDNLLEILELCNNKLYCYDNNGILHHDFPINYYSDILGNIVYARSNENEANYLIVSDNSGCINMLNLRENKVYKIIDKMNNLYLFDYNGKIGFISDNKIKSIDIEADFIDDTLLGTSNKVLFTEWLGANDIIELNFKPYFYPNPTKEKEINLFGYAKKEDKDITIEIFTLAGDKVYDKKISVEPLNYYDKKIDLSNFASGIYVAVVKQNSKSYRLRFAVIR